MKCSMDPMRQCYLTLLIDLEEWLPELADLARHGDLKLPDAGDPWGMHAEFFQFAVMRCEYLKNELLKPGNLDPVHEDRLLNEAQWWWTWLHPLPELLQERNYLECTSAFTDEARLPFDVDDDLAERRRSYGIQVRAQIQGIKKHAKSLGFISDSSNQPHQNRKGTV